MEFFIKWAVLVAVVRLTNPFRVKDWGWADWGILVSGVAIGIQVFDWIRGVK